MDWTADLHADATRHLEAWEGGALRAELLAWVGSHPEAADRHGPDGHLTVSTVVVDPGAGSVLLVDHPKFGRWMQLGGHLEPTDTSVHDAALRETLEESGLDAARLTLDPVMIGAGTFPVSCPAPRHGLHLDLRFLVLADSADTLVCSDESLALAWWPLAQLPARHDDDLALLVRQARVRLGH